MLLASLADGIMNLKGMMIKKHIIFGGSFNPITYSHIGIAISALKVHPNSTLYWCLGENHAFKNGLSPYKFRMNLIQKAVPNASVLPMGKYMWDFLISLAYIPDEVTLLIGNDILNEIHLWKNFEELINLYHFTIINRGTKLEKRGIDNLSQMIYNVAYMSDSIINTSSSEARQRVKEGKSIGNIVPDEIINEVEKGYATTD